MLVWFVLGWCILEVYVEVECDEVVIVYGGVFVVEEVGVGEVCGVGVLVFCVYF